jgi:SAM-dependent methyltransferase
MTDPLTAPPGAPVPTEAPPCLLCGGEAFRTVLEGVRDRIWFKPGRYQLQRCEACGFVQTRPRPRPGDGLGFYYSGTYSGSDGEAGIKVLYETDWGKLLNLYRVITIEKVHKLGPADEVLDVGCSYGHFLSRVRELRGSAVAGVDMDAGSVAGTVLPAGTHLTVGTTADLLPTDAGRYSVITFLECLEHVPDPVQALREARALLRPGGVVMIEVPNWRSFWRVVWGRWWMPLFVPQHLSHFAPATLRDALVRAGLEPVHHQTLLMPIELVLSLRGFVHDLVAPEGRPPPWVDRALGPVILVLWFLVELPVQFWLRAFGVSGHQVWIARRPEGA